MRNENLKNNELEDTLKQLAKKLRVVNNNIEELKGKHEKLEEKRHFIQTSISKTNIEIENLNKIQSSLEFELEIINKNKVKLLNEARALQDKNLIVLYKGSRMNLDIRYII